MDRGMEEDELGPFGSQASGGALTAMRGTIVDDEEHATSGSIGFPAHDLSDETLECSDAVLAFAAVEQPGAMHIPGCEVGQRTGTRILVLDIDRPLWGVASDVCVVWPGCWSSHRHRVRNHAVPELHLASDADRVRGRGRLCGRSGDQAARSRCGDARGARRPDRASARGWCFATRPRAIASWRKSASGQRANGSPRRDGSSHANALSFGFGIRAPGPGAILRLISLQKDISGFRTKRPGNDE